MTEEQIEQRAERYAETYVSKTAAYIGGAHSMFPEVDKLKGENKYLKEALSTRKTEIENMEFLRRQDIDFLKELLNNAVSMLKDIYEDDDYFCTMLLDIDEEAKICEKCCDNLNEKCILRYLKHYKKEQ